uniref:Niban apoptosis regulator 1b n=1 Tax=Oncorhynchus kisutch TaxID=8019 RepID=A0A8C7IN15_ONCKI
MPPIEPVLIGGGPTPPIEPVLIGGGPTPPIEPVLIGGGPTPPLEPVLIGGRAESELKNFSPHYRQQYFVAFFSQLQEEVEQHKETHTQLLKQREPLRPEEVLYQDSVLHYDDTGKWKERFVVMRANHSLECHDNQESFSKGVPARQRLLPTGGVVLTSEEKYTALVDKAFPDPKCLKEETSPPMVVVPSGQFPVYLRLPYRRDVYFSFPQEDRRATFLSILTGCIRHQNHDSLRRSSCESQAFLKAIHFYRQEKGHYESWDMLVGCEEQVLANLVLEELQPSLQTELLARLKGKKAGRKRVWFTTLEAAYHLVQDQLREGLKGLKEECKETARSHEALLRSDMDQIASSRTFLQAKLQASVSDPAAKFCSENVSPYLASILEELMSPVTGGFHGVRLLLEGEINTLCLGFPEGAGQEGLNQMCQASLEECYQKVEVLTEQLQELRHRFKFSNSVRLIHCTQIDMQQLIENAVYTFKLLLQSSLKDNSSKLTSAMEKAKLRVLKQYDHDSSTVRKRIFQEALVDITLPAIRRNLAPAHKPDLQKLDQYIFADYTNFIKVENVYEDILLNILTIEVDKGEFTCFCLSSRDQDSLYIYSHVFCHHCKPATHTLYDLFVSSVSGKYLRNCAPSSHRCFAFDIVLWLEFNDGKTCVLSLLMQTEKSSNFLIIASILSRTLNIVAESPCNPRFRSIRRETTSPNENYGQHRKL